MLAGLFAAFVAAFRLETRSGGGGEAARRDDPRDDKERKVQSRVLSHFMISRLKCEACGASRATSSTRCTDKTATRRIREVEIGGGERDKGGASGGETERKI